MLISKDLVFSHLKDIHDSGMEGVSITEFIASYYLDSFFSELKLKPSILDKYNQIMLLRKAQGQIPPKILSELIEYLNELEEENKVFINQTTNIIFFKG